ncbi:hypothetical protein VSDG_02107 [Cytospora chrysosperma]|uniref:Ubiquitin 3 binding protein But2 C-terminal domain-containing protein n=1 Tax=Cytospora chrysosperma TaxID=252740 RepID=A0A423WET7_CYTCH|nr:hypothetical protein VSDG_02107 [Valsa sordida]
MHCTSFLIAILGLLGIAASAPTKAKASSPTTAAPTHTAPSTCATYYPSVLRQLVEAERDVMHANTAKTAKSFHVAQSVSFADNVKFNRVHQYVVFDDIPAGSWDCQLMVSWPHTTSGMHVTTASRSGQYGATAVSLDVYSASYNASAFAGPPEHKPEPEPEPKKGAHVGTADQGPFATWGSMMSAIAGPPGANDLSAKGDGEQMQDRTSSPTSARLTYFGTVGVHPGEYGVTVNSEACPRGSNGTLGFLFEIPSTDARNASVEFLGSKEDGAGVYMLANC